MDGTPCTLIGVLVPCVKIVWRPMRGARSLTPDEIMNRQFLQLLIVGRLKPNVTFEHAQHEMNVVGEDLAQRFSDSNARRTVSVELPLLSRVAARERESAIRVALGATRGRLAPGGQDHNWFLPGRSLRRRSRHPRALSQRTRVADLSRLDGQIPKVSHGSGFKPQCNPAARV